MSNLRCIIKLTLILGIPVWLTACGGGRGSGDDAAGESTVVTEVSIIEASSTALARVILPGPECPNGGVQVDTGIDDNGNGILDPAEVDSSQVICNGSVGTDGLTALVKQTEISAGVVCAAGGVRFDVGKDQNANGVLDAFEITDSEFLCSNGQFGVTGAGSPVVVSAISISNSEVLLQFSESMAIDAENPIHYSISTENHATRLPVWDSAFANAESTTVLLSTFSQSSVSYVLTVANVHDLDGNPIADPTILINPSQTNFVGTDPSGLTVADSDGDKLPDHTELTGWDITITYGNGTTEKRRVTSDPGDPTQAPDSAVNIAARDTDNDGVTDNEERHGGIDPRQPDTDGDTLTDNQEWNIIYSDPSHQDTDGDGTQDGFEFYSYRTSPVLADTDGDQISDTDEVLGRNRDPRIADLPLYSINIGELRLQIDERYTYEDTDGKTIVNDSSSSVTMNLGTSSSERHDQSAYAEALFDKKVGAEQGNLVLVGQTTWKIGGAIAMSKESVAESQRVSEQSFNKGAEFSTTSTVTREIVGAQIDAGVSIENRGDLAFAITNLEVTVLQLSRASTRRFIPVATLIANSTLISGEAATFNLGPFTTERGPILFSSRDVFPNLVDQLMQSPPGALVFEIVNFDVIDELGREFTFTNQSARDRTASIIVDTGDENIQRHLVATALQPNPDGLGGAAGEFVGGFNGDGSPKGISLDFALQDILELSKNSSEKDGIVAGINQTADSIASGDDVQLIPPGTTGVSVGSIVISAGQDGILESIAASDDERDVTTGYETSLTCSATSGNARQVCSADSDCIGAVAVATCTGPETLVRFGSQRNGDFGRQWAVLTTATVLAGADFGRITLKPREDIYLAFVQDLDQDGIFAREEFLSGSTDSSADVYDNSSFGDGEFSTYDLVFDQNNKVSGFAIPAPVAAPDGIPDSKDTDRDGLGDFAEIRVGWKVSADGGLLQQVYPSPRLADSDGDGMLDPQEQDLSPFCFPAADGGDPRQDALCRFQIENVVSQANAISIIAGSDGIADSLAVGDDEQRVLQMTNSLTSNTIVIGPGIDGIIDTLLSGDDQYQSSQSSSRITPSSNPLLTDTDADGVGDFAELNGYLVGRSIRDGAGNDGDDFLQINVNDQQINCGANGMVDTALSGDDYYTYGFELDIQHSYGSICESTGSGGTDSPVILSGRNGVIDSIPNAIPSNIRGTADTLAVGDDIQQAYLDGPVFGGGIVVLPGPNGTIESTPGGDDIEIEGLSVVTDPLRRDTDSDLVADGRERDQGGDPTNAFDGEQFRDSDQDGLSDTEESILGWMINPNGLGFRLVLSNPSLPDSDFDGLPDLAERILRTDPNNADTDGDRLSDYDELSLAEFEKLVSLNNQHPGFLIDGVDSRQYGSSPLAKESDGDGRNDYQELVEGYTLVVPGESVARQIFTNPRLRDTDADGIIDGEEVGYSDATVIDTDGDGRSDGVEKTAGTDPLVPDVGITVTYKRLILSNIPDSNAEAEIMWFFMVKRPGDPGNGILLSNAADCDQRDDECGVLGPVGGYEDALRSCPVFKARSGIDSYYILPLGLGNSDVSIPFRAFSGKSSFTLREGESFSVNGALFETDYFPDASVMPKCGLQPYYLPTAIRGGCVTQFDETFRYSDFDSGGQANLPFPDGSGTAENCDWTIEVEIEAN